MTTDELLYALNNGAEVDSLLEYLPPISFLEYLYQLMNQRQFKKKDLILSSNIDKTYCYQILSGIKKPGRNKVLMCALALKCSLDETNRLLQLSENQSLYVKNPRDMILIHALIHHKGVIYTNFTLEEKNLELLL